MLEVRDNVFELYFFGDVSGEEEGSSPDVSLKLRQSYLAPLEFECCFGTPISQLWEVSADKETMSVLEGFPHGEDDFEEIEAACCWSCFVHGKS